MSFIRLVLLVAVTAGYVAGALPTAPCNKDVLYTTQKFEGDCRQFYLCRQVSASSFAWVASRCMGTLFFQGDKCVVPTGGVTQPADCTATTVASTATTPVPVTPPTDDCDASKFADRKKGDGDKDFWLCMPTPSGYRWVAYTCPGTLVWDEDKNSCQIQVATVAPATTTA